MVAAPSHPSAPSGLPFMNEHLLRSLKDALLFDQLDPILLIDLLLCFVMGGDKHLIVRTLKRDEETVKRIVGAMTMNIFGKHTQNVDLTPSHTSQDFLRDLFIHPPRPTHATSSRGRRRGSSSATTALVQPPPDPATHQHDPNSISTAGTSSSKRFSATPSSRHSHHPSTSDSPTSSTFPHPHTHPPPHPSRYRQPRPIGTAPSSIYPALRPGSHLYAPSTVSSTSPFDDPHTHTPKLPGTYLPHVLVLSGLEKASHAVQMKFGEVVRGRRVVVLPEEGEGEEDGGGEGEEEGGTPVGSWNLPRGFVCVWVKVVEGEGEGREAVGGLGVGGEQGVGSWLYDLFTLCYDVPPLHPDIDELIPPPRLQALITPEQLDPLTSLLPSITLTPPLTTHLSNLLSATLHHPYLLAHITPRTRSDMTDLIRAVRVVLGPLDVQGTKGERDELWAGPGEVARVWTAGMKHRCRLREGGGGGGGGGSGKRGGELMRGVLNGGPREVSDGEAEEKLGGKGERLAVEGLLMGILRVV